MNLTPQNPTSSPVGGHIDPAGLVAFRVLYGLLGAIGAIRFMLNGWVERFFAEPTFFFRYWGFEWVPVPSVPVLYVLFGVMALAGLAVALGYRYRLALALHLLSFLWVELIDVTNYLNHYHLWVLLGVIALALPLHRHASLDVQAGRVNGLDLFPLRWARALQLQVALVYVFAGLAKANSDWLVHAQPLNIWLAARQDFPLIGSLFGHFEMALFFSWAGFLHDLFAPFLLLWRRTRTFAFAALYVFHLTTHLLFDIGMFPFIMTLAATTFLDPSWPRHLAYRLVRLATVIRRQRGRSGLESSVTSVNRHLDHQVIHTRPMSRSVLIVVFAFFAVQILAPLRAHLYPGDVNWHEQGMRWSWRVMVREKNGSVLYRVSLPGQPHELHIPPSRYLSSHQEREMSGQPDLILQLAHRIRDDFLAMGHHRVEVRVDAFASLNGRPMERLIDPTVDLARVSDSLAVAPWILPPLRPAADSPPTRTSLPLAMDHPVKRALTLALTLAVAFPAHAETSPQPEPGPTQAREPEPESEPEPGPEGEPEPKSETEPEPGDDDTIASGPPRLPDTVIRQKRRDMFKTAGSVQLIEEDLLQMTEYDDPQAILQQVPGVYARGEDGYGLRPNIGIRGVTSERSQKVTLLEDGLLFGPAPYSAPAGYFFPLMTRMVGLEVLKGPAAVLHGPNTIGGAVNVLTRAIPRTFAGAIDLALGSAAAFDNIYGKVHGHLGTSWDWGGMIVEVVHLESTGFKQLDTAPGLDDRPNTGFSRTEVMLKAKAHTDLYAETSHKLELKLGVSRELSNETYLGLTDADFAQAPNRRYLGSQLDRMDWDRYQVELRHNFAAGPTELVSVAYWRSFARAWRKLNRFRAAPSLEQILEDPSAPSNEVFYRLLTGLDDSLAEAEALMIGTNDRRFTVLGAQTTLSHRMQTGAWRHKGELSLRLHYDSAARLHTEEGHLMTGGRLVRDATPRLTNLDSDASALALASYLAYGLSGEGWTFTPGARVEWITNRYSGAADQSSVVVLPGLGIHRELVPSVGVFGGLYRGFSPVAPGQSSGVSPETSLNWELGLRWLDSDTGSIAELVGFWNDYHNLVGTCGFSSGCRPDDLDRQFNGGAVTVVGLEAAFAHRFQLFADLTLPVRLAYTLTRGVFDSDFTSDNPQFGRVEVGDHLPYVPTHQLQVQLGLARADVFSVNLAYTFVDAMREEAGQSEAARRTDAAHLVDLMSEVQLVRGLRLYLRGENLLMRESIASRRPFGARPVKPFSAQLGVKWSFGGD